MTNLKTDIESPEMNLTAAEKRTKVRLTYLLSLMKTEREQDF